MIWLGYMQKNKALVTRTVLNIYTDERGVNGTDAEEKDFHTDQQIKLKRPGECIINLY